MEAGLQLDFLRPTPLSMHNVYLWAIGKFAPMLYHLPVF